MASLQFALAVLIGILVLGVLVLVHELGHFIAAKACKFRVQVAAIGFGKALFTYRRGETDYRINAIPFGGYVAMASGSPIGETEGGDNEFNSHPIWQRAVVAAAGPAANFIVAVFTLWIMFISGVERPVYLDSSTIGGVEPRSAADSAGFKAGDSIVNINGEAVTTWDDVQQRFAMQLKGGYTVGVWRDGEIVELSLNIERTGGKLPKSLAGGLSPNIHIPPIIGGVSPGSAAHNVLAEGDTLLMINDSAVGTFGGFSAVVRTYDPETGPLKISVKRGGDTVNVAVVPVYDKEQERYMLGVSAAPMRLETRLIRYGPIAAAAPTLAKAWEYTTMIFDVIGKLTSGKVSAAQLSGPLNIIPMSGFLAFDGLASILNFMALIGINLGVLNLLPLVITDGGLLMFLGIEAVRGKPLPVKTQMFINKIFMALFIALFVFVTFNDVLRLPGLFNMLR